MAYTNAIFYLDYVNGSDATRANLVPTDYAKRIQGVDATVKKIALSNRDFLQQH